MRFLGAVTLLRAFFQAFSDDPADDGRSVALRCGVRPIWPDRPGPFPVDSPQFDDGTAARVCWTAGMTHDPIPLATVDDLYRLPNDERHYELVQGRIVFEPPPGDRHGRLSARLVGILDRFLEKHPVAELLAGDPGFVLSRAPDTVRAPDIADVEKGRYLPLDDESILFPGAPAPAIEILSPGNRASKEHEQQHTRTRASRGVDLRSPANRSGVLLPGLSFSEREVGAFQTVARPTGSICRGASIFRKHSGVYVSERLIRARRSADFSLLHAASLR